MRDFNYSTIREQKWDSEILGLSPQSIRKLENRSFT